MTDEFWWGVYAGLSACVIIMFLATLITAIVLTVKKGKKP